MWKNDKHNWTRTDNSSAFVKASLRVHYEKLGNMKSSKIKINLIRFGELVEVFL